MTKQTKVFLFFLVILFLFFLVNYLRIIFIVNKQQTALVQNQAQATLKKQLLTIGKNKLNVEVAKSFLEQANGLSFREKLGSDGMLFILPKEQRAGFWMKDMKFDIDIIWISEGKIVEMTQGVRADSYEKEKAVFYPKDPIDWVLELEAGKTQELGLEVGQLVILE